MQSSNPSPTELDIFVTLNIQGITEFLSLHDMVNSVTTTEGMEDQYIWRWTSSGVYSVHSSYNAFFEGAATAPLAEQIWKTETDRRGGSSTVRILVATDCHLGYLDKDEIRRHDTFVTFEEICSLAEQNKVDFLLLGGNLFHENNPSLSTLVKTMEILRRYCLNDRPVQFQVVSDQAASLQNRSGRVNFEDPNLNVGLPVFTIHGNLDDPTGADNLSAIDILSACNFVNYFGKVDLGSSGVGQIAVRPLLIKKGATSVALYGLGNIRDVRLGTMIQTPDAVQWMQPESLDNMPLSNWFNIMILHQKRVEASPGNGINEHLLPCFMDVVIWGHEHECLVDPQEVPGMGFHLTQPGSSVATSLTSAEAKQKHVLLLEIKGMQYRPTKIPLKSVRPFEYAEVLLEDQVDVDPNAEASVHTYLDEVVNKLIQKNNKTTASGSEPKLPLVRIKVDYSGFLTINPQRFGQKYVGKVANPHDILVFSRSSKRHQSTRANTDGSEQLYPNDLNQHTVETLVAQSNLKMHILPVNDLDTALHDFVNKDDNMAFHSCSQKNIDEAKNKLTTGTDSFKIENSDEIVLEQDQCMQALLKARTQMSQDLATSTLSAFEELKDTHADSDELVETTDDGERHQLARGKRPAPTTGRGSAPSSLSSSRMMRRKTDLALFRRIPAMKEEDGGGTKKGQTQTAGRYGAIRRRCTN